MSGRHIATAVLALVLTGTVIGGAEAGSRITGRDIKDGTVTGMDLRDQSVTGLDIADRSLTAGDIAGPVTGPAGPAGRVGDAGTMGPAGRPGALRSRPPVVPDRPHLPEPVPRLDGCLPGRHLGTRRGSRPAERVVGPGHHRLRADRQRHRLAGVRHQLRRRRQRVRVGGLRPGIGCCGGLLYCQRNAAVSLTMAG